MRPAGAQPAQRCFLSYSRADADVALRFANDLESLGVAMWVDRLNIRPSEHWDRAIERAIRGCRCMVMHAVAARGRFGKCRRRDQPGDRCRPSASSR